MVRVATFILLMASAVGCVDREVPNRLIGTWMATSPAYRGRFIEFSEKHIVFSSDENHSIFYTIHGVESKESEGKISYTIEYSGSDDDTRRLALRFSDGDSSAIELENISGIWIRKEEIGSKQKESIE